MWSKLNYIHLNPVRQNIVANAHQYLYCSASNYILNKGLLEIEFISMQQVLQYNSTFKLDYELW
jgi:hypothetical protein